MNEQEMKPKTELNVSCLMFKLHNNYFECFIFSVGYESVISSLKYSIILSPQLKTLDTLILVYISL